MKNAITAIVTILLIASVAGNAYFFLDSSSKTKKLSTTETELSDTKTKLMAVEKEHAKHTAMDNHMHEGETMAKDDDSKAVIEAAKAYHIALSGGKANFKTDKIGSNTNIAGVGVTPLDEDGKEAVGGYGIVLKKANGIWVPLYGAQSASEYTKQIDERAGITHQ